MSEVIEPLDPADAAAIAEGVIALDDARPLDIDDDLHTDAGPDSERVVVWDEVYDSELEQDENSGFDAYVDDAADVEEPPEAEGR